jgi:hypothetical protein
MLTLRGAADAWKTHRARATVAMKRVENMLTDGMGVKRRSKKEDEDIQRRCGGYRSLSAK